MRREWLLVLVAALGGCSDTPFRRTEKSNAVPVVDRAALSATAVSMQIDLLTRLVQGRPAEQAEMLASAQHDVELAPTPAHRLRLALVLAAPGHAGTDLPRAQRLLRELLATPEALLPGERALAILELAKVDNALTLLADNTRLQTDASREEHERVMALNKRLQSETDENAKLRKDLEEARAKLDAIANIERSLNERKPAPEGRKP